MDTATVISSGPVGTTVYACIDDPARHAYNIPPSCPSTSNLLLGNLYLKKVDKKCTTNSSNTAAAACSTIRLLLLLLMLMLMNQYVQGFDLSILVGVSY
jgi:hypothetical protein